MAATPPNTLLSEVSSFAGLGLSTAELLVISELQRSVQGESTAAGYTPAEAVITWTDKNGSGKTGSLATFTATADMPTVSTINVSGKSLTSFHPGSLLPSLASLNVATNLLSSLDITGLTSLVTLVAVANLITSLDVSTNPLLKTINCSVNALRNVDQILATVNGFGSSSGTLALHLGSNAVPTGGASNADVLALRARGWTVNINP